MKRRHHQLFFERIDLQHHFYSKYYIYSKISLLSTR